MYCKLKFTEHGSSRAGERGIGQQRVKEAFVDPKGKSLGGPGNTNKILATSEDGTYLFLLIAREKSCNKVVTVRLMDQKEKKKYRRGF